MKNKSSFFYAKGKFESISQRRVNLFITVSMISVNYNIKIYCESFWNFFGHIKFISHFFGVLITIKCNISPKIIFKLFVIEAQVENSEIKYCRVSNTWWYQLQIWIVCVVYLCVTVSNCLAARTIFFKENNEVWE